MLNNNDIKLVEKAVTKGFRDQDSSNAWERIKKELSGSGQNSAEKTQPEGETNKTQPEICPRCGGSGRLYMWSEDGDGRKCSKCNGAGKLQAGA